MGQPRLSNWIPLQHAAEAAPYSIKIAVAETKKKKSFCGT